MSGQKEIIRLLHLAIHVARTNNIPRIPFPTQVLTSDTVSSYHYQLENFIKHPQLLCFTQIPTTLVPSFGYLPLPFISEDRV